MSRKKPPKRKHRDKAVIRQNGLRAQPETRRSFGVRQVGRALSVHPETVRDFLRNNRISGIKVGNRWRVTEDTLNKALAEGVPLPSDSRRQATDQFRNKPNNQEVL